MTETKRKRHVRADRLRELGFPEKAISEAVRAEELGLFDVKPSSDLVERTIARCRELLPRVRLPKDEPAPKADWTAAFADRLASGVFAFQAAQNELAVMLHALTVAEPQELTELSRFERLPADCLATVDFAWTTRQRPLMIVDNHNLIDPEWWNFDTGFMAMRSAVRFVNTFAQQNNILPAAIAMILRPGLSDYSEAEIKAIGKLLSEATSDVWMVPYEMAGSYQQCDVIVLGDQRALTLDVKVSSPGEAFSEFHELTDRSEVYALRAAISKMMDRGVQVRGQGKLANIVRSVETVDRSRAFIGEVIKRGGQALS
jgi:hypothetical protein